MTKKRLPLYNNNNNNNNNKSPPYKTIYKIDFSLSESDHTRPPLSKMKMKFLGWMHRKLMQNSVKNTTIGIPSACLSDKALFEEHKYYVHTTQSFSNGFKSSTVGLPFQESYEPFEFLAIGTFGAELPNPDPPTPKLPTTCETLTNQQIEATESDLELTSYKLEKFLEADEEEIAKGTSPRSSQASIITLSGKTIEGADSVDHTCLLTRTLQNYFFAKSSTGEAETYKQVKKERASLEELFKRKDAVHDDDYTGKCEVAQQPPAQRKAGNLMKRVVKKFHSSSSSTPASKRDAVLSTSIKKKLSKGLKMFRNKVHPEGIPKNQIVNVHMGDGINVTNEHKIAFQEVGKSKDNTTMKRSSNGICKSNGGGHWIKTDSDYLVLELED